MKIESCEFTFDKLTKKLYEEKPVVFEYNKIQGWLSLLQNDTMYPYDWKIYKNGLKAKCKPIESKEEWYLRYDELKLYIKKINKLYNIDIQLVKDDKEIAN